MPPLPRPLRCALAFLVFLAAAGSACGAVFEQVVVDPTPPTDPWMKGVGDLDGDGAPDLVVCGRDGPLVWYQNPGWTRRTISSATGTAGSSTGLALGDVDGNGSLDVVLANGVWFANPAPGGDPVADPWVRDEIDATTAHDVVLADLDGDRRLDVVKRHQGAAGDVIRVFRQGAGLTWSERTIPASAGEGLAVGDLDGDGDPDIAIAGTWYQNDGDPINGDWTPHVYTTAYTHPDVVVKIGNIGGSSRPDIVLTPAEAAGGTYRVSWFEAPANASALWPEHVLLHDVETVVHGLALADFDRNGRTDLAIAEMHQGADPDLVRVLFQDLDGSFQPTTLSSEGSHNLAAGDVDGDGRVDLFGANHNTSQASDGAAAKLWLNRTAPEPAGALLPVGSLGALVVLGRRRRGPAADPAQGAASAPAGGGP